jgi:hypothetical protein
MYFRFSITVAHTYIAMHCIDTTSTDISSTDIFVLALPLFKTRCEALVRTNTEFVIKALNCSSLLPTLCQVEVSNKTGTSGTGMCSGQAEVSNKTETSGTGMCSGQVEVSNKTGTSGTGMCSGQVEVSNKTGTSGTGMCSGQAEVSNKTGTSGTGMCSGQAEVSNKTGTSGTGMCSVYTMYIISIK